MDLQAVLMSGGPGSRIQEITSGTPKCLLPVGNMPLIMCSLNVLKRAGFTEAIVVVQEQEKAKIQSAIENKTPLKLDIVAIPKNVDWGTADSLRHIKDKLRSKVLVLSCDIVTDFNLLDMLSMHRTENSSLTILLVPFLKTLLESDNPGNKKKCKFERDIIGLDSRGRMVFINSEADFEENVPFKLNTLLQHPQIRVHSNLMDAHVYLIGKELVNFIVNNTQISTLKGEFLPAAVKKQFASKKQNSGTQHLDGGEMKNKDWIDLKELAFELSSYSFPPNYPKPGTKDKLLCFSYIDRECYCTRVNTLVSYIDINKRLSKHYKLISDDELPKHEQFLKSQVDADSIVGNDCELLGKASVKQTSLGNNCKLGEKTKVVGSVVMDNVIFGENCSIQNCIVCPNVKFDKDCSLKNCIVGPDQVIKMQSKFNSEVLQGSDHLIEI